LSVKFLSYSDSLISDKLATNVNSLKFYLDDCVANTKAAAISMATNTDVIKAVKSRNTSKLIQIVSPMCELYRIQYYTICDYKGIVLARTYDHEYFGDSILHQRNIKDALDGKITSHFESGDEIKVSLRTGVPVYDTDGTLIGAISSGIRFDTEDMVDALKQLFNAEVTVFHGSIRIATTVIKDGQRGVGTVMDPSIAKIVFEDRKDYSGDVDIFGVEYKTFYTPLLNADNEAFAALFLGTQMEELKKESTLLIIDGIVIGLIGLVASMILLYTIISSISKPIIMLADDMENIADGNLYINTKINTEDELGRLSTSLEHVVNIIHKLIEDINVMIAEQESGNTDYILDTQAFHGDYKILANHILELAKFGMRDQLTGIPNRRSFDNRLHLEWKRAIRGKKSISTLLLDVDKFKNYNDAFGHQQGDVALQSVAKILSQSIKRAIDFAARWGGEEFIVLLPDTDASGALQVAEKIRLKIETMHIPCEDEKAAKVTVSIGVAVQMPTHDGLMDNFISEADEALYKAKETGRNRIVLYENAKNTKQ
jgi:diguanylate cyclase (GGDEF)-like protein